MFCNPHLFDQERCPLICDGRASLPLQRYWFVCPYEVHLGVFRRKLQRMHTPKIPKQSFVLNSYYPWRILIVCLNISNDLPFDRLPIKQLIDFRSNPTQLVICFARKANTTTTGQKSLLVAMVLKALTI